MKKKGLSTAASGLTFLLMVSSGTVHAATFTQPKEGKDVTIASPVDDDLYATGNQVLINEAVGEDAYLAGQTIEINSSIAQDLTAAGERITVNASVEDDAYLAGNTVTIANAIRGDLFAAAQRISVTKAATIRSDAYLAGQTIEIAGVAQGSVRAAGESIVVKSGARIEGDLITYGGKPVLEEGAIVAGQMRHKAPEPQPETKRLIIAGWVRSVMTLFLIAILLLYSVPRLSRDVLTNVSTEPGKAILTAAMWFVLVWPAAIILLITIIGIPFAAVLLLLTPVLYIVASGYAALVTGKLLFNRLGRAGEGTEHLAWPQALLGAVVYETVQLLPLIGFIATCIIILLTAGSLLRALWSRIKDSSS